MLMMKLERPFRQNLVRHLDVKRQTYQRKELTSLRNNRDEDSSRESLMQHLRRRLNNENVEQAGTLGFPLMLEWGALILLCKFLLPVPQTLRLLLPRVLNLPEKDSS